MAEEKQIDKCNRCNDELRGRFCSNCGNPQKVIRINGQYILTELAGVLNFQKGILFTVRELLLRPQISIKKFIHEDRNSLVKPISFIIVCSLFLFIAQETLGFQDGYMNFSGFERNGSTTEALFDWIGRNYGLANVIMAVFIAIWLKIFFKKYDYNVFEILILLYFAMGIQMLMFAVFGIAESVCNFGILDKASILAVAFVCWVIGQFFDGGKIGSYAKAFFSYFFGMISFLITALACGSFIDYIIK